jgi:bacteriorhodopsin
MIVIWPGYGIVWALSEGGNVVSPDVEGVLYGILDLLGGPVFGSMVAYAAKVTAEWALVDLQKNQHRIDTACTFGVHVSAWFYPTWSDPVASKSAD